MGRTKIHALAGAALFFLPAASALAADIPEIPAPAQFGGSWYLKGYIGMTNQHVGALDNVLFDTTDDLVIVDKNFEAGMLAGLGIGFQHSEHLRFDVTGEYRGEAGFHGMDTWTDTDDNPRFNNYTAKKSEWTFLANAYWDLPTWKGITPYLGVGAGMSYNTIHSFRDEGIAYADPADLGTAYPTLAYADAASKWSFAWAVHAGVAMKVNNNLTLDLGYSYVDLGNAQSGDIIAFDGTNTVNNPMEFNHLYSHDFKLGLRWAFDAPQQSYYPPVVKY